MNAMSTLVETKMVKRIKIDPFTARYFQFVQNIIILSCGKQRSTWRSSSSSTKTAMAKLSSGRKYGPSPSLSALFTLLQMLVERKVSAKADQRWQSQRQFQDAIVETAPQRVGNPSARSRSPRRCVAPAELPLVEGTSESYRYERIGS